MYRPVRKVDRSSGISPRCKPINSSGRRLPKARQDQDPAITQLRCEAQRPGTRREAGTYLSCKVIRHGTWPFWPNPVETAKSLPSQAKLRRQSDPPSWLALWPGMFRFERLGGDGLSPSPNYPDQFGKVSAQRQSVSICQHIQHGTYRPEIIARARRQTGQFIRRAPRLRLRQRPQQGRSSA